MKTKGHMTICPAIKQAFYTKMHSLRADRLQSVGLCGRKCIKLVQITLREFSVDRRLRRLLCGKAVPFRRWGLLTNLIRAAEGIAFGAARMRRKPGQRGRKGRAFPHSKGQSPIPPHALHLIWTRFKMHGLRDKSGRRLTQNQLIGSSAHRPIDPSEEHGVGF